MIKTGLASVSFRQNSVEEIVNAAAAAGLDGIEWGSDIHVPSGDLKKAEYVKNLCGSVGLSISSYGSYFRFGVAENTDDGWAEYLKTASALGTDVIRVWCGNKGSREISGEEYSLAVNQAKRFCKTALDFGITAALECHNFTVTDDYNSSLKFLRDAGQKNLKMYWQPNQYKDAEYNLKSAKALSGVTENVHTFHWIGDNRYPLSDGIDVWKKYADIFKTQNRDRYFLLEFMHDDDINSLSRTAEALRLIIK